MRFLVFILSFGFCVFSADIATDQTTDLTHQFALPHIPTDTGSVLYLAREWDKIKWELRRATAYADSCMTNLLNSYNNVLCIEWYNAARRLWEAKDNADSWRVLESNFSQMAEKWIYLLQDNTNCPISFDLVCLLTAIGRHRDPYSKAWGWDAFADAACMWLHNYFNYPSATPLFLDYVNSLGLDGRELYPEWYQAKVTEGLISDILLKDASTQTDEVKIQILQDASTQTNENPFNTSDTDTDLSQQPSQPANTATTLADPQEFKTSNPYLEALKKSITSAEPARSDDQNGSTSRSSITSANEDYLSLGTPISQQSKTVQKKNPRVVSKNNGFKAVPFASGHQKRATKAANSQQLVVTASPDKKETKPTTLDSKALQTESAQPVIHTAKTEEAKLAKAKQAEQAKKTRQDALREIIAKLQASPLEDSEVLAAEAEQLLKSGNPKDIKEYLETTNYLLASVASSAPKNEKEKKAAAQTTSFNKNVKPYITTLTPLSGKSISVVESALGKIRRAFSDKELGNIYVITYQNVSGLILELKSAKSLQQAGNLINEIIGIANQALSDSQISYDNSLERLKTALSTTDNDAYLHNYEQIHKNFSEYLNRVVRGLQRLDLSS